MWTYAPWQGRYLPGSLSPRERLHAYATWCNAVEGNTTFYATPTLDTVKSWAGQTTPDFRFVLKLPKLITHESRLADSDGPLKDVVIVTNQTKQVAGVTTTLVFDRVFSSGKLSEKTYDFFAQDKIGNVWYFGENSQQIDNGKIVGREGSWEAGVNGATQGIVMQAVSGQHTGHCDAGSTT